MYKYKSILIILFICFSSKQLFAQYDVPLYTPYSTNVERGKMNQRLINFSINKNLSLPLTDSTEENWEDAFSAIEFLLYRSSFSDNKVHEAFRDIENRSVAFQLALLELAYSNYPEIFRTPVKKLLHTTTDSKVYALCAEYLVHKNSTPQLIDTISTIINSKFGDQSVLDPVLYMLQVHINEPEVNGTFLSTHQLKELFSNNFLPGQIVMFSIQRKNRDYPGMVLIRNKTGKYITDSNGNYFHIPQLARSITNLPFYMHAGNTPQGIFLMHGFGVSLNNFIGPTANVQLALPVESSVAAFLGDSSITDTLWNVDYYKKLIPENLKNYMPLYYSYYAGLAGRTEIIAHGTTIDPSIYINKSYYPLTPSEGCLCTKEIWNGMRLESDQQKLVNALLKAGGANGYCVVIELDNKQSPVTLKDVLPYLATN